MYKKVKVFDPYWTIIKNVFLHLLEIFNNKNLF